MQTIIVKEAGKDPEIREVETIEYEMMSELVGGYIEHITVGGGIDLWINDEGKIYNLPLNFVLGLQKEKRILDTIQGNVFFCGHNEDESVGLTEAQTKWIMNHFDNCDLTVCVSDDGIEIVPVWDYDPTVTC